VFGEGDTTDPPGAADARSGPGGVAVVEDDLVDVGMRFEEDGGVSLHAGTDADDHRLHRALTGAGLPCRGGR